MLVELEIAERNASGLAVVKYNGQNILTKYNSSPQSDILTLEYMLEVFIDLCGNYGPSLDLCTREHFQINKNFESIFKTFSRNGYAEKHPTGYVWTDKMDDALKRNFV